MARKAGRPDPATDHVVVGIEISARKRQVEVKTMRRGRGRHQHYASLSQVPPELRGEALQLIRTAILNSGYDSLAEFEEALTSELVMPEAEDEAADQA